MKFRVFWNVALCSHVEVDQRFKGAYCLNNQVIALMMEAVGISETSVKFNVIARCYIPEVSKLYTRRRENLKSHKSENIFEIKNFTKETRSN
jgi:hypothetical protein